MIGTSGCSNVAVPIEKGKIDEKNFIVYNIKNPIFGNYSTKIEILDKSGNIEKIIMDYKSGKIGDEFFDYVETYLNDGKKLDLESQTILMKKVK